MPRADRIRILRSRIPRCRTVRRELPNRCAQPTPALRTGSRSKSPTRRVRATLAARLANRPENDSSRLESSQVASARIDSVRQSKTTQTAAVARWRSFCCARCAGRRLAPHLAPHRFAIRRRAPLETRFQVSRKPRCPVTIGFRSPNYFPLAIESARSVSGVGKPRAAVWHDGCRPPRRGCLTMTQPLGWGRVSRLNSVDFRSWGELSQLFSPG